MSYARGVRSTSLFVAFALSWMTACSSSDAPPAAVPPAPVGDAGGPTADAGGPSTTASEVCAPIHRSLPEPNKDRYIFYASDAEAVSALTTFLPKAGRRAPLP